MTGENHEVTAKLAAAAELRMPDEVAARIEAALRHEAQTRIVLAEAGEAKATYVELVEHSALGTFGANLPRNYDRAGVGIEAVVDRVDG